MHILYYDNEENAVLSVRIIMDFYKSFKMDLESFAVRFIDFVQTLYSNMPDVVDKAFNSIVG